MESEDCPYRDLESPVAGRQRVNKLNVVGDAQADLAGHGEQHPAVFVYQAQTVVSVVDLLHYFWVENVTTQSQSPWLPLRIPLFRNLLNPSRSHCHARPPAIGGIENLPASCGF
jgi:hypothetical protein